MTASPRDRFITVYGRVPVLEALEDDRLAIDKVLLASGAVGPHVDAIQRECRRRGVTLRRVSAQQVTRVSRNGRQDQGVAADVVAPSMGSLEEALTAAPAGAVLVLDGVTNPQNVGMVLRTATAAGVVGVVLPRAGVPDITPLVIKASAGVAFRAPVLRSPTPVAAVEALAGAGYRIHGLASSADRSLFDARPFAARSAFVLGSESAGVSTGVAALVHEWVSIPMAGDVESLNVAVAAGVVCFELLRRGL